MANGKNNDCDKGFSGSYMLLKPEEVGFFDLIHILFSRKVDERKFVDYCAAPETGDENGAGTEADEKEKEKEEDEEDFRFRRRWMIFISILAQKFMLFNSTPLLWFGWSIEMWLNLVACNRNIGRLFFNLLRGNYFLFFYFFLQIYKKLEVLNNFLFFFF